VSLLHLAEILIGPVDQCPTQTLEDLFFETPTLSSMRTLLEFFFGNDIPCDMAMQLHQACKAKANVLITDQFSHFFTFYSRTLESIEAYISI